MTQDVAVKNFRMEFRIKPVFYFLLNNSKKKNLILKIDLVTFRVFVVFDLH